MAPKDRSISPTTITRVSPIAMIATELIARSTDTARLGLAKFGLTRMNTMATTITAANRPPTRTAMASVARPTPDRLGPRPAVCDTSLLIGRLLFHRAVEFLARLLDVRLQHGLERLRVGQDDAVLE